MLSKEEFWVWFQESIQGRWPRCEFTTAQLQDWYWRLKAFSTDALSDAAQRHSVCDEPRRPSLKAIYAHVRQSSERRHHSPARTRRHVPDANTYIQCIGRDDRGGGQPGFFVPILIWPFGDHHTPDAIERAARHQASRHRQTYGGIWQPVFNTTRLEMLSRQSDLQKSIGDSDCTRYTSVYNEPVTV